MHKRRLVYGGILRPFGLIVVWVCLGLAGFSTRADEGMWLLTQLNRQTMERMQELGLQLTANEIYDPRMNGTLTDAIVQFGGGCTGSVISKDGFVITNHHCGHGYIQQLSSVEHNYLEDGFVAKNRAAELPVPGLTVTFVRSITDVTDSILKRLPPSLSEDGRAAYIDSISLLLAKKYMGKFPNYDAEVKGFYQGNRYYLFMYETFRDIRLVMAPPVSIGSFGGDTDNWFYPRHTCDFSLFRIYVDANNRASDYSADNVPYKPKRYLNVSLNGYQEGDFSMVMGFPGSTERFITSFELKNTMEIDNYHRALIRGIKQEIWQKHMDADPKVKIQYAAKYKQSSNYWKNSIGQNQALKRDRVMEKMQAREREFTNWFASTKDRAERYNDVLPIIMECCQKLRASRLERQYYVEAIYMGCEFTQIHPAFRSLKGYIEKGNTTAIDALRSRVKTDLKNDWFKDYNAKLDQETTARMLKLVKEKLPAESLPSFYRTIDQQYKGDIDRYVAALFAQSVLVDYDRLVKFLENPQKKQLDKDMGFAMCESFFSTLSAHFSKVKPLSDSLKQANRLWVKGLMEKGANTAMYPDANSSLRLTYGTVMHLEPRDGVTYNYYTTMDGLAEKMDDENPDFKTPDKLKQIYENRGYGQYAMASGVMPVNFITNNDITGGNSGSPVLNAKGELIGLAFDGNWESLSGDISFTPKLQRCINVDIRYVLMIIHKYAGATHIIDELSFASSNTPAKGSAGQKKSK